MLAIVVFVFKGVCMFLILMTACFGVVAYLDYRTMVLLPARRWGRFRFMVSVAMFSVWFVMLVLSVPGVVEIGDKGVEDDAPCGSVFVCIGNEK